MFCVVKLVLISLARGGAGYLLDENFKNGLQKL